MAAQSVLTTDLKGYEIRDLIGRGGFGAVYRAYQPAVGREVAVKIIAPEYANQPDFVRRFETEAQIIARLEHFHIVPLYDYWRDPDGAYFVMRYLRGGTVRDMMQRGVVPLEDMLRILDQITAALMVAHRNNIIHRDMKPDNILLDDEHNAYLADFGIAKLMISAEQTTSHDVSMLVGSPAYASPEQITDSPVLPATDQYGLAMMIYEMLAGIHPYHDLPVTAVLTKQMYEPLPSIRRYRDDLPAIVDMVLSRATAKASENRYENIQAFTYALKQVLMDSADGVMVSMSMSTTTSTPPPTQINNRETLRFSLDWMDVSNPYKGLRAFQEADADDFFGREQLTDQLLGHLREPKNHFLAVVGASGSGKSSVVKAGVLPAIRSGALPHSDQWFVVEMLPGAYPIEELEAALLRISTRSVEGLIQTLHNDVMGLHHAMGMSLPPNTQLLLYIDQFEEVFTFVEDEDERAHFIRLLYHAINAPDSRLRVIVTLRADFYDRPLLYTEFGEMFRSNTEVVLPMNEKEIERSILGPATRLNMRVEPALLQALIQDIRDQPGALPLLQYALTELFERRDGPELTLQTYTDIGGALGALTRRADDTFTQLDASGQEAARQMLLRLVTLGEGTEDTRRRAVRSELIGLSDNPGVMDQTINLFSRYRLLTLDRDANTREPTVEIAHESLIREWSKLRDWLNSSREDLRMQRRVFLAADEWRRFNRDISYLALGNQLEMFEGWLQATDLQLSRLETQYIEESIAQRERTRAKAKAQAAREQALEARSQRVLIALVGVLVVAVVIAIGLTIWALNERDIATQNARIADRAAAEARSYGLAAQSRLALTNNDIDLAVTLALAANTISDPPPISESALFDIAYHPGTRAHLTSASDDVSSAVMLPNGETVIYAGGDGSVSLWEPSSGSTETLIAPTGIAVNTIALAPTAELLLLGAQDGTLTILNLETQAVSDVISITVDAGSPAITAATFGDSTNQAFIGLQNGEIVQIDPLTGTEIRRLSGHGGAITAFALSSDRQSLASASVDRTVRIWGLANGTLRDVFEQHQSPVRALLFNGEQLISGAQNGEIYIHTPLVLDSFRPITTQGETVWSLALGKDRTLLAGGQDGIMRQWEIESGTLIATYTGHTGIINAIAPAQRPGNVITASADGTLRLWNFYNDQFRIMAEDADPRQGGLFSLDYNDGIILSGGAYGGLKLWDGLTGELDTEADERITTSNTSIIKVAFIDQGQGIITASQDGSINYWDVATGEPVVDLGRHLGIIEGFAVSPNETQLATSGRDGTLRIWELTTGEELQLPIEDDEAVTALAYSPDGSRLAVGTATGQIWMLNTEDYTEIYRLEGLHERNVLAIAFNSDGSQIATGSQDLTIRVLNATDGTPIQRFAGHADPILSVTFTPDDTQLLTASGNRLGASIDGSIRLWDIATGQQLRQFGSEHGSNINDLVFDDTGTIVYAADGDSDILRWNMLPLTELIAYTEANRYARPLTCAEQALYNLVQTDCS